MKDIKKQVTLLCPACGKDQFDPLDIVSESFDEAPDEAQYKCSGCGSIFTKQALISGNAEKIDIAAEEFKQEFIKEFAEELKKVLKDLRS